MHNDGTFERPPPLFRHWSSSYNATVFFAYYPVYIPSFKYFPSDLFWQKYPISILFLYAMKSHEFLFLFSVSCLYQAIKPILSTRIVLVLYALYSSSILNFLPLVHSHLIFKLTYSLSLCDLCQSTMIPKFLLNILDLSFIRCSNFKCVFACSLVINGQAL